MHRSFIYSTAAIALIAASGSRVVRAQETTASADRFAAYWLGSLSTPSGKLRLALAVTRDSAGALTGVLASLDQGNARIPATVTVRGDTLFAALPAIGATFTGVITVTGDSLRGSFVQGIPLPLELERVAAPAPPAPPSRPQEPKAPFPYRVEDVTFESVAGVRLAGTLTTPSGPGPFPAVVLVSGSGAQDRNEEIVGHKPFLVIADHLARRGIAALRYDDRGYAKSTGIFARSTTTDFARDAEAAVHFLQDRPGVSRDRVGIIGHSEGGLIAPMVAARSTDVAFIALLAGPGLPGDSLLLLQQAALARASGTPAAAFERGREANRRMFAAIRAARDSSAAAARLTRAQQELVATLAAIEQPEASRQLNAMRALLLDPWWMTFLVHDPRPTLRMVRVPVLALNGTLDLQVPARENLPEIAAALKTGGNRDYTIVEMPGLNHLFQTATAGNPSEYGVLTESFSPAALEIIATWIATHSTRAPTGPAAIPMSPATQAAPLPMFTEPAVRRTPTWVKWGLVGAAAGAVALPLIAPLASDSPQRAARDVVAGAAIGFVVIGGSVALWQAICGPDSASRRAGLCGR